jgi:O-antigen/teichoic acid export membrane protein
VSNILKALRNTLLSHPRVQRAIRFLTTKFARDFSVTAGSNLFIAATAAIGGILSARLLGPTGRGELAAALVWAATLSVIGTLGLPQALTYFTASHPADVGDIFATAMVMLVAQSLGTLAVGYLAIDIISRYQPLPVESIRLYLLSIPFTLLTTYLNTIAQGLKRFTLFNAIRIASSAGYIISLFLAGMLGQHRAKDIIILLLVSSITIAIGGLYFFLREIKPKGNFHWQQTHRLLGYGLRSYWGSLSWMANGRLDQFVMSMSAFINLNALGEYAVAVSYSSVLFPLSGAFASTLYPRVAGGHKTDAPYRISKVLKLNLFLTGMGAVLLSVLTPLLIPLLFGSNFTSSIYPAMILLLGSVFLGCNYVLSDGLRGMGHPLITSIGETAGAGMTVLGLILLLPTFGIIGAAWVSVISYAVVFLILMFGYRRKILVPSTKVEDPQSQTESM